MFLKHNSTGDTEMQKTQLNSKKELKGINCSAEGCNITELCLKYQSDRGLNLKDRES